MPCAFERVGCVLVVLISAEGVNHRSAFGQRLALVSADAVYALAQLVE